MNNIRRPLLITLSMWFFALGVPILCIGALIGATAKSIRINGILRDNEYFIKHELPWVVIQIPLFAALFYSIRTDRWWYQHIPPLAVVAALAVSELSHPHYLRSHVFDSVFVIAVTIWYFYFKRNVRTYYGELRRAANKAL